jgi:hypothetical protein
MKFCSTHWDALRENIKARGLWDFVSKDGAEAGRKMVAKQEANDKGEPPTAASFDPLLLAHMNIVSAYIEDVGINGMVGDKCPICEVEKSRAGLGKEWLDGSCDDMLRIAKHFKLIATD